MSKDEDFQKTAAELKRFGQASLTKEERIKRKRALDNLGVPNFQQFWLQQIQTENKTGKTFESENIRSYKLKIMANAISTRISKLASSGK